MHVKTQNLTKIFYSSVIDQIISLGRNFLDIGQLEKRPQSSKVAVDNVSLRINSGERVGIIGENGTGKTTLLQMISGLAEPTSGTVETKGQINCIMTLGVGLKEELTGRENIYLDGETTGKSRSDVESIIDEIVKFADIGEFIDRRVKTYSSGMKSRLAFAIITCIEPEILIIDEALSVGDTEFSMKASKKMREISSRGKIVILVSHDMSAIVGMCNRCVWMDKGQIVMDGEPAIVTSSYLEFVRQRDEAELMNNLRNRMGTRSYVNGFEVKSLEFLDKMGKSRLIMSVGDEMSLRINVSSAHKLERPDIKITFERADGVLLMQNSASEDGFDIASAKGNAVYAVDLGAVDFGKGIYEVRAELLDREKNGRHVKISEIRKVLKIENPSYPYENPAVWWENEWSFEAEVSR
jgi:lipopolysaccharide transport system ATP-binding protein